MFFLKHLRLKNSIYFVCLLLISCSDDNENRKSVAEVNSSKLYEEEINFFLNSSIDSNKNREEYIRNWIETEVLYQEAKNEGILDSLNYKLIIEQTKKELAVAILTKKIIRDFEINTKESALIENYNAYKADYRLDNDAYVISYVVFNDLQTASIFRKRLLDENWDRLVKDYKSNKAAFNYQAEKFLYKYQVQPSILTKYIQGMLPNEVSIVINANDNMFYIVKLVKKYYKYDIPDYDYIKPLIKRRLLNTQQKIKLKNYISELYSKYDVKINR